MTATARPRAPVWRLAGFGGVLLVWQAAAWASPGHVVPAPAAVAVAIGDIVAGGLFWPHVTRSLRTIGTGFAVAYGTGLVVGMAMGRSRWWDGFFRDLLHATLMMPGLVVVVVVTMMLGLGESTAVVAVVLTAVPYGALTIAEGVRALPADLLAMARAYRVGAGRRLRDLTLPASAPFLLTAARYVFSLCWQTTTLAEVIGGTRGIGFMMKREFQVFDMAAFLAWCTTFFAVTILIEQAVLARMVARSLAWRPDVVIGAAR